MYVNIYKNLPRKGRKANTNIQQFESILNNILNKYKNEYSDDEVLKCIIYEDYINRNKDASIYFDFENILNFWDDDKEHSYINKYNMELININGKQVPIICAYAGGDWEYPVNFIIYLDDKNKLRMYVPKCGNTYNALTKEAIGNDDDLDEQFCLQECQLQNIKPSSTDEIEADYNLMMLDIKSRLIPV